MKKMAVVFIASSLIVLVLAGMGAYWAYQMLQDYGRSPINTPSPIELKVERGTSFYELASQLQSKGLIEDAQKLKWLARIKPSIAHIRSGLYQVDPADSIDSLLLKIAKGQEKVFSLTLVDGLTLKEWSEQLKTLPHMSFNTDVFNRVLLANGDESNLPEGKFFPDTYQYRAGESLFDLMNTSYQKMQQELTSAWENRAANLPVTSSYQLLILASIIEKETAKAEERPQIAAVFMNRLRKGMRLQTDPSVIYGMGERYKGNITRKDLRELTPFNTYRIKGLTPTPIAAPSGAAIEAAAHPATVDYLYFVSRNDGSHVFSKTLKEHNRAVNKYQRNR
ncbi:endolytic transglycosylase MltG [Shewanella surugensis]|uniref:Endolytic murein transglycosylase n=1 Tax=Shewanella surugensis TaxID=212020 RepID=A0ABT0L6X4_9GAMM|nr:endolytic transglycosylase MltG [Shewanella surugensis]MCL1123452.1 endolytic transglycosylase MltG [Shewanella surugensis]